MTKYISTVLFYCLWTYASMGQEAAVSDSFLIRPYLQWSTKNSITVLWETTAPATSVVEFGEALQRAEKPNLSQHVLSDKEKTMHEVLLDNLRVETKYVYRVRSKFRSGLEIVSPVLTFKTTVEDSSAFMFAFIGDTQQNDRTPWAWGKVADRIYDERPNFIINAGDIVDEGSVKDQWVYEFFKPGRKVMERYPMFTVLGNHEQDDDHYYMYMSNPPPEYCYSFRYGSADFFMIDSNKDVREGSEQYDWLEWQLARSTAKWKFVVHHHPPYSSDADDHGDTFIGASSYSTKTINLVPLYEKYGVDFCLFGHTHMYERSWPIFENRVNMRNGVVYINSGGAGGGLEDFDPTRSWFTKELQTGHHYTTFAIFNDQLMFRAVDHEGRLFDTFQMEKGPTQPTQARMLQPPPPDVKVQDMVFSDQTEVTMSAIQTDYVIRYTLDGSEPGLNSTVYKGPIEVRQSLRINAKAYTPENRASRTVSRNLKQMSALPAKEVKNVSRGLRFTYYEIDDDMDSIPDFTKLNPVRTGVQALVNETDCKPREERYALVLEGYVRLADDGLQRFYTRSDDGSKLYIDGQLVVDNDGQHGAFWQYGDVIAQKGLHQIRIEYFENAHGQMLRAGLVVNGERRPFSLFELSH